MRTLAFALAAATAGSTIALMAQVAQPTQPATVSADYGKLPLSFEANQGQTAPEVKFTSRGKGYSLFLTGREAVLALSKPQASSQEKNCHPERSEGSASPTQSCATQTDTIQMQLVRANPNAQVHGADQLPSIFPGKELSS